MLGVELISWLTVVGWILVVLAASAGVAMVVVGMAAELGSIVRSVLKGPKRRV